jgi:hypothetical protein
VTHPTGNSGAVGAIYPSGALHTVKHSSVAYQRHEPEKTDLHKIVSEHLETFLREVRAHYEKPLPKYVEKELRDYLRCGLLQHGFAKAICKDCGRSILVAFSCKRRGTCPSCNARRMCNGAAHLVDHVIPCVPVRQWVLSVPFELRLLLACRADAFGKITSLFVSEVFRWQRERAREDGLTKIRYGALVMQHRFGSSLNLNTHLHAVFPDGVFSRLASGMVEFQELRQPKPFDLEEIAFNVHQRFMRWLRRHGLLKNEADDEFSNEATELSALEACAQGSLGLGNLVKKRNKQRSTSHDTDESGFEQRAVNGRVGMSHGYSLYAGNAICAEDKDARERLLRYCLRAPLSLERLSVGPDGNVIYQVKATRHGNETQRVMTPMQFMSRLVALIPPPYHPLLRYFGVFGPHSSWRKDVVPQVTPAAEQQHDHGKPSVAPSVASPSKPGSSNSAATTSQRGPTDPAVASTILAAPAKGSRQETSKDDVGPRLAAPWRIDWATLLRRVHSVDALACPCGGRLKFVDVITEPTMAREILQSMGLPPDVPPIARARSPDFYQESFAADWD